MSAADLAQPELAGEGGASGPGGPTPASAPADRQCVSTDKTRQASARHGMCACMCACPGVVAAWLIAPHPSILFSTTYGFVSVQTLTD